MTVNSKRYLVITESVEVTVARQVRQLFRKVFCPFCGAETNLFRRDGDAAPTDGSHLLMCSHKTGKIADQSDL